MPCGETELRDDSTNLQRVGSGASTPRVEPKLGLSGTVSTVVMQPTQTLYVVETTVFASSEGWRRRFNSVPGHHHSKALA
jgi:hypothetical protein